MDVGKTWILGVRGFGGIENIGEGVGGISKVYGPGELVYTLKAAQLS